MMGGPTPYLFHLVFFLSRVKADSGFTSVFRLKSPSCAMGNTAECNEDSMFIPVSSFLLISNVFMMKYVFFPIAITAFMFFL